MDRTGERFGGRTPLVSIVLPAYNCAEHVGEAVESMLAQTFTDFELIVIDDGSTDATPAVVAAHDDPRLRLVSQANQGLPRALNRGIAMARGRYIARQDHDDWSLPERLAKQVAFLEAHPNTALVGTWAQIWRGRAPTGRVHAHPATDAELKFFLLLDNPFVHSSVMVRKAALEQVGGYSTDPSRQPPEDFELWSRIARAHEVANLPEVLHVYREVGGSMSRQGDSPFASHLVSLCAENIALAAGTSPTDRHVVNLAALQHGVPSRLFGEPDFQAMREVFRTAARQVTGAPADRFQHEADRVIDALEERWREAQRARTIPGRIGSTARRFRRAVRAALAGRRA